MPLPSGTRLGPYEIVAFAGAGGMGEVYRARDTRLDRTVAIKVLPEQFSRDSSLKQRFEREARAISSLSHPNICHLYDVGHQDGAAYLVMEYIEGESLAARLNRGPLPLEQVLKTGIEIASALERAHHRGIVHRDLKPGNVMLTKSGAKLLDFGLAKPITLIKGRAPVDITASSPPEPITHEGHIIGTVQYMSPEQVEGKDADARSDIFALGALLYEMATGKRAFDGKSTISVAGAILEKDPEPMSRLRPLTPPAFEYLVTTCLAKDPDERVQTAHDVKVQLTGMTLVSSQDVAIPAAPSKLIRRLPWIVATALTLVLALLVVRDFVHPAIPAQRVRSSILPPPDTSFVAHNFALSPNGRSLAFAAVGPDGRNKLWIRSLDSARSQQLAGTENAIYPFWSPDSQSIGFFADRKLKTIDLGAGALRVLCDAPAGRGATWNSDGVIVFAPSAVGPLLRVSAAGGAPSPVTKIARQPSGQAHRWPAFLPDGRHFLFMVYWSSPADRQKDGIYVGSLDSTEAKLISADITGRVAFSSGHLIFVRNRSLIAQPFDISSLRLTGAPVPLAEEELDLDPAFSDSNFSASAGDAIIFYSSLDSPSQLLWFDRTGNQVGRVPGARFQNPRLSPDGRTLAFSYDPANNGRYAIYVYDLGRGLMTHLTEDSSANYPIWSRDSQRITYVTYTGDEYRVYEVPADASGTPRLLMRGAKMIPNDWSPDGKYLMFMDFADGLPVLSLYSPADGSRHVWSAGAEGQFSPDGHLIALVEAGGDSDIWVREFPSGSRMQISSSGAAQALWSRDGSELFYMAGDRKLMRVQFDKKTGLPSAPQVLFQTRVTAPSFTIRQYDLTLDGSRFVVNSLPPPGTVPLTLLSGAFAGSGK